jgi:hypothetical protein
MENQIYRINLSNEAKIEFYVCKTNNVEPNYPMREMGIVVYKEDDQVDGNLQIDELESLISYLEDCKRYIEKFNESELKKVSEDGQNHKAKGKI